MIYGLQNDECFKCLILKLRLSMDSQDTLKESRYTRVLVKI